VILVVTSIFTWSWKHWSVDHLPLPPLILGYLMALLGHNTTALITHHTCMPPELHPTTCCYFLLMFSLNLISVALRSRRLTQADFKIKGFRWRSWNKFVIMAHVEKHLSISFLNREFHRFPKIFFRHLKSLPESALKSS